MFCGYHLFIKGTVLTIMKILLQALIFTLVSVTYASAETKITCSNKRKGVSLAYAINDVKQEIRRLKKNVNAQTLIPLLWHEDMIIFDIQMIGEPYKNPPERYGVTDNVRLVRHVLDRRSGKLDTISVIKWDDNTDTDRFHLQWDCTAQGKQF